MREKGQGGEFGAGEVPEEFGGEVEGAEEGPAEVAGGGGEDAAEFVADAFGGDAAEVGGVSLDGGGGGGVEGEVEAGGEADGAEETEVVFGKAAVGVADGTEDAGGKVGDAADVVDDLGGRGVGGWCGGGEGVFEEAVDGEVATEGVFFGGGEADLVGAAAVGVGAVGAEGGDFDLVAAVTDENDAEGGADGLGVAEEFADVGGGGGGGDVVVFGGEVEKGIADAAAGEVGGVVGVAEAAEDVESGFAVGGHGGGIVGSGGRFGITKFTKGVRARRKRWLLGQSRRGTDGRVDGGRIAHEAHEETRRGRGRGG